MLTDFELRFGSNPRMYNEVVLDEATWASHLPLCASPQPPAHATAAVPSKCASPAKKKKKRSEPKTLNHPLWPSVGPSVGPHTAWHIP